jgi:hypothetical protein
MWRVNPNDATSILYDDECLRFRCFYDKPISAKGDALTYTQRTIIVIMENYTRSISTRTRLVEISSKWFLAMDSLALVLEISITDK